MDTRDYLKDKIDHYNQLLESKQSWVCDLDTYIKELRTTCIIQLNKIKQADTEAMIMANASVSPFPHTKQV
jgi:prefoldin subunit 5